MAKRQSGSTAPAHDGILSTRSVDFGNAQTERAASTLRAQVSAVAEGGSDVTIWLRQTLEQAVRDGASDIHFEPFESLVSVRMRVDGVLRPIARKPISWMALIASRIKVMADLDIAECRLPQDGRIAFSVDGRPVALRVSTIATISGESIVARILDQRNSLRGLESLGMSSDALAGFRQCLKSSHGLVVVTGPTGSGKTTTVYGALAELGSARLKMLSAEDPVEYDLEGVMQASVSAVAGVDFASLLRSFLRHDPDVIMVGEMRDPETARVAVQAALTGHLVITTLHTPDSASVVARMVDLGIEPFLIASALVGVLAQRLVRRRCSSCAPDQGGCAQCLHTGFNGRLGVHEFLCVDDGIRELIVTGASAARLREAALRNGMRTLREAGLEAAKTGIASLEDVLAVTAD